MASERRGQAAFAWVLLLSVAMVPLLALSGLARQRGSVARRLLAQDQALVRALIGLSGRGRHAGADIPAALLPGHSFATVHGTSGASRVTILVLDAGDGPDRHHVSYDTSEDSRDAARDLGARWAAELEGGASRTHGSYPLERLLADVETLGKMDAGDRRRLITSPHPPRRHGG